MIVSKSNVLWTYFDDPIHSRFYQVMWAHVEAQFLFYLLWLLVDLAGLVAASSLKHGQHPVITNYWTSLANGSIICTSGCLKNKQTIWNILFLYILNHLPPTPLPPQVTHISLHFASMTQNRSNIGEIYKDVLSGIFSKTADFLKMCMI